MNFKITESRRYSRYFQDLSKLYERKEAIVYTGLILSLFVIALLGFFALRPTFATITSLVKETQEAKDVNQRLQNKINALREAQTTYTQISSLLPFLNQALPSNTSPAEFIFQLEILAQKQNILLSGLNINTVTLIGDLPPRKDQTKKENREEIDFSLTARGSFENIQKFLDGLVNLRRLVIIDSFALNQGKAENENLMNLTLQGRTFYQIPKSTD